MGYSIKISDNNCYEGTTCLINKFNIKDDKKLSEIEVDITFAKTAILESESANPPFDFEYYKSIHRFLFNDLYSWAGELRKTDISKKGTSFCSVKELNDKFERYLYDPNTVECSEHIEPLCYDLTLEVTKELIDTIPTGAVVAYCSR